MVREPFQRIPNSSSIDRSGADTTESVPKVEAIQRFRPAGSDPTQPGQDRAQTEHEPGSNSVHQESFKRYQPGLQSDEQNNCPLDGFQRDVQMFLYGFREESPRVLQVRDSHHRDDARN